MEKRLSIHDVIKNFRNWPSGIDFDAIQYNHELLWYYMNKMYFSEKPTHPEIFVILFSFRSFGLDLLNTFESITKDPETIWLTERNKIDKEKLQKMGLLEVTVETIQVVITNNGNNFFLDIFF